MRKSEILVYILGTMALMVIVPIMIVAIGIYMPKTFLPKCLITPILGGMIAILGVFFTVWANLELYKKGKGGPAVFGKIKLMAETSSLVTTGPYALCRNPMHLGLVLLYVGLSCAVNSLYSLVIPLVFGVFAYAFAIFLDEPRLRRDFGAEFAQWASTTPRFLPKTRKKK
jgi:protein-S-isoprenylcysteine O-methyltransferase Ste14